MRGIAADHFSLAVYQEFGKVPLDGVDEESFLFLLEEVEERMSFFAIHINLVIEIGVKLELVFDKGLNVSVATGLLKRKCYIEVDNVSLFL